MTRFWYVLLLSALVSLVTLPSFAQPRLQAPGDEYWDNRFGCRLTPQVADSDSMLDMAEFQGQLYGFGMAQMPCLPEQNVALWSWNGEAWQAQAFANLHTSDAQLAATSELLFIHAATALSLDGVQFFDAADNILAYDGLTLTLLPALPVSYSPAIYAMTTVSTTLFVAVSNGTTQANVLSWNGSNWADLGALSGSEMNMLFLEPHGVGVTLSGTFTDVAGVPAAGVAEWNGSTWIDLGAAEGVFGDTATLDTTLYALWKDLDTTTIRRRVAETWETVTTLETGNLASLRLSSIESQLYLHGDLTVINDIYGSIWRWNASTWQAVGTWPSLPASSLRSAPAVNTSCRFCTLLAYNDELVTNIYAYSYAAAGYWAHSLVWSLDNTTQTWLPLPKYSLDVAATGPYDFTYVTDLAATPYGTYLSGNFRGIGNVPTHGRAAWNAATWHTRTDPASSDVSPTYDALWFDDALMTLDSFIGFSSIQPTRIVRYNPDGSWDTLGETTINATKYFNALAVWQDQLYVAGTFAEINNTAAPGIAFWNGSAWQGLPSGPPDDGPIFDLLAGPDGLYAAVAFSGTVMKIWRWDGTHWAQVASSASKRDEPLSPLIWFGDTLHIFSAGSLYKLVENAWQPVPNAPAGIRTMAVGPDGLYVGGTFCSINQQPFNNIARWDGNEWQALGSGVLNADQTCGNGVNRIAIQGRNIVLSGDFSYAGPVQSRFFAIWQNPDIVNSAPTTRNVTITVEPNTTIQINLHKYAWDIDGDPLTFANLDITNATLTDLGNGIVEIVFGAQTTGSSVLTYTVSDDQASSTNGQMTFVPLEPFTTYLPFTRK